MYFRRMAGCLIKSLVLCFSLMPLLATAESQIITGSATELATFKLLAESHYRQHPETYIKILPSIGNGGNIKAVKQNAIDIALLSRTPNDSGKNSLLTFIHYRSGNNIVKATGHVGISQ